MGVGVTVSDEQTRTIEEWALKERRCGVAAAVAVKIVMSKAAIKQWRKIIDMQMKQRQLLKQIAIHTAHDIWLATLVKKKKSISY